jgi:hypothetical protein
MEAWYKNSHDYTSFYITIGGLQILPIFELRYNHPYTVVDAGLNADYLACGSKLDLNITELEQTISILIYKLYDLSKLRLS